MLLRALRPLLLCGLLAASGAAAVVVTSAEAVAKGSYDSPYGYDRTWNAAVRMVRVDMGFKVTEKDDSGGYLLFEYRSSEGGNRTTPGSIELVRGKDADMPVKVLVQLSQMPHYHEQAIADALQTKMREEYGEPPQRRRPQPAPAPVADGGADSGP